jgi:hypothetical protein
MMKKIMQPNGLMGLGHTGTHVLLVIILLYLVFFNNSGKEE